MPKIIVYDQGKKKVFEVGEAGFTIGRSQENDYVAPGQKCSREHCKFELEGDGVKVVDLGSRNGTLVNDKRVKGRMLSPGDVVKVGDLTVFFETDSSKKSGMTKCPSCFNMIPKDAVDCEHCGEEMDELGLIPRCATCQKEQNHGGTFCTECGSYLKTGKSPNSCVQCQQVIVGAPELCPACGASPYPATEEEVAEEKQTVVREERKQNTIYTTIALASAAAGYAFCYFVTPPADTRAPTTVRSTIEKSQPSAATTQTASPQEAEARDEDAGPPDEPPPE